MHENLNWRCQCYWRRDLRNNNRTLT